VAFRKLDKKSVTEEEQSKALYHFFEELSRARKEVKKFDDAFYFSFLNFAMVRETSQDKARARSIGTYRFWRQSVEHEDEYIFGKIVLSENPKSGALEASMLQVRQATPGLTRFEEHFSGHLFRVSHLYLMMLRDHITNDVRITFFTHRRESNVGTELNPRSPFKGNMPHNVCMDGHVFGIDGQKRFFAPLHLSLVDDVDEVGELDDKLDIIKEQDMPERVLKKLQGMGKLQVL
jgi:hypothetical protein